ncbi:MAG: GGDEF domain-containing protein [Rhodospirillaceae bacterium]
MTPSGAEQVEQGGADPKTTPAKPLKHPLRALSLGGKRRTDIVGGFSVTALLALVFGIVLMIAVITLLVIVTAQQNRALDKLATQDARVTAKLAEEHLLSVMRGGGDRDDLVAAMERMRDSLPYEALIVHRSPALDRQFGVRETADLAVSGGETGQTEAATVLNETLQQVFATGAEQHLSTEDHLSLLSPILVREDCQACHQDVTLGDVNGVLEITFDMDRLRAPMESVLNSVFYALALSVLVLFVLLYFVVKLCIGRPISGLTSHVQHLLQSGDYEARVTPRPHWPLEVRILARNFNRLLANVDEGTRRLRQQSEQDPLTGLFNRRYFDDRMARQLELSERVGEPVVVMLLDLNGFKPINDTYGHDSGDRMLQAVSNALVSGIRERDVLARIGGDEFAFMSHGGDVRDVPTVAQKLRDLVAQAKIYVGSDGQTLSVGAAVGTAIYPQDGRTPEALMKEADRTMYADKLRQKGMLPKI